MTDTTAPLVPAPVKVSPAAYVNLSNLMRRWSDWRDASLTLAKPVEISNYGVTDHVTREFTINVDALLLNPHRVLLTVTPFRLRQEAVLSGVMLHEAGHARYTHWKPRTTAQAAAFKHNNGKGGAVDNAALNLASLLEEARVEALMARAASDNGASGLGWTMRASAAMLTPATQFSSDPDQFVVDVIESWVLRAGRQYALSRLTNHKVADWTHLFTALLKDALTAHIKAVDEAEPDTLGTWNKPNVTERVDKVIELLIKMASWDGVEDTDFTGTKHMFGDADAAVPHTGTFMVDTAQTILTILFPETDEPPSPSGGCGSAGQGEPEQGEAGESEDQGQEGSQDSGGEGESDEQDSGGEGESDEQGSGEGQDQGEGDSPAEGDSDSGEPGEGEGEGQGEGEPDPLTPLQQAIADALAQAEAKADAKGRAEGKAAAASGDTDPDPKTDKSGQAGGIGNGGTTYGWRDPSAEERDMQREAEGFLRDLINPSEVSTVVLTESPSTNVDPGALAAWRAGGQVRDPRFFRRTKRTTQPSTPVKIAVLVDTSYSMSALQRPSALLSWALSCAVLDLRNFAGRGAQIESTLIHWGDTARVIAGNGKMMPGLRTFDCQEGTGAMDEAFDLVDTEIPGFFDEQASPSHRLLVQFTDWQLRWTLRPKITPMVDKALSNGVNMLTVAPTRWRQQDSNLTEIMRACRNQVGGSTVMKYDPNDPGQVWKAAAEIITG